MMSTLRYRAGERHSRSICAHLAAGIEASQGEYLGFVDSDDSIAEDMYETLLRNLLREQADISIIGTSLVGEDGESYVPYATECRFRMNSEQAFKYVNLPGYFHVAVWDKLYRRELFDDVRFPVES